MRILHIIDSYNSGGAEKVLLETIRELKKSFPDFQSDVVFLYNRGNTKLLDDFKAIAKVHVLGLTRVNIVFKTLYLCKYFRLKKYSIVHSHICDSSIFARLALPKNVKLVSTYHSAYYLRSSPVYSFKRKLIDKLTYRQKYHTIFVSNSVKDNISEAIGIKSNFTVLPNFCSPNFEFKYIPRVLENGLRIVSVGNLIEAKNYTLALNAILACRDLEISLDIFGEGPLYGVLLRFVELNQLPVKLMGIHEISSPLLANYDLFLMTSNREGMPIALIEAMTSGLPCLLSDIPALVETSCGAAMYFNSVESLQQQIKLICENKKILVMESEKMRQNSMKFSRKAYVYELSRIYNKLVS